MEHWAAIPISSAVEHVRALRGAGAELHCWSSGGAEYARASAQEVGLEDCFVAFLPKPEVLLDDQHPEEWRRLLHVHPMQAGDRSVSNYVAALNDSRRRV